MPKFRSIIACFLALITICGISGYPSAFAASTTEQASESRVYWLSSSIEANQVLQLLADRYFADTGNTVEIVTVPEAVYQSRLDEALADNEAAPTLFEISGFADLKRREEQLYNLRETDLIGELASSELSLSGAGGQILAVPSTLECFGIIVNTGLLSKVGHSIEEIQDYSSLKKIVEEIHMYASQLGFDAFTSSPLDEASRDKYVAQTANVALYSESANMGGWQETPDSVSGIYIENYKNIWDLYIKNSPYKARTFTTDSYDPLDEFGNYKAVFFQGTSHDYDALVNIYGMFDGELAMLPMYSSSSGEGNLGLGCSCDSYWGINKNSKEEDIKATVAFLKWLLTDTYSTELLSRSLGALPYKAAKSPVNVFLAQALEDIKAGKTIPHKAYEFIPNRDEWCAQLIPALEQYNNDPADYAWEQVRKAFIDGWSEQFIYVNR